MNPQWRTILLLACLAGSSSALAAPPEGGGTVTGTLVDEQGRSMSAIGPVEVELVRPPAASLGRGLVQRDGQTVESAEPNRRGGRDEPIAASEVVLRGRFPGLQEDDPAIWVAARGTGDHYVIGTIGEDGGYEIHGLEPGEWMLTAVWQPDWTVTQYVTIPPGVRTVTRDLPFPRGGETLVVHNKGGSCRVDLFNGEGFQTHATFDSDGVLRISGLAPGTYQLSFNCLSGPPLKVTLPQNGELMIGEDTSKP